jgi:hypothetical protein
MTLPDSIQQLTNLQKLKIMNGNPELTKWCNAEENRWKLAHIEEKVPMPTALPGCLSYIYCSFFCTENGFPCSVL